MLDENFNNHAAPEWQGYSLDMLGADFGEIAPRDLRGFEGGDTVWPAKTAVGQGVLRANFPPNTAGSKNSGFVFDKVFPDAEEATLEFRVRFEGTGPDKTFQWAAGGKLPGLGGSTVDMPPTGCTTDVNANENGFTARAMWREEGELVTYVYTPDRDPATTKCGLDISFFEGATADRWYTIRQHIRMNTPGQRDGVLEMFVDGQRTLAKTDMLYRLDGKSGVKINSLLVHTFRGGKEDNENFFSPNNDHIQFDDFKVWAK
ncbi:MAG: polysaccharide lyase [Dermatophilaceae bacterium]